MTKLKADSFWLEKRCAGVLCHITSLPTSGPIGDLGGAAYAFIDFLEEAGQRYWQLLPTNPIGLGNSGYSTYCSFAGEPLLIDLEELVHQGLLQQGEASQSNPGTLDRVDYDQAQAFKKPPLVKACQRWREEGGHNSHDFQKFVSQHSHWLADFALYTVLASHFQSRDWSTWPQEFARRDDAALASFSTKHQSALNQVYFEQYIFDRQWQALKAYASQKEIQLIGDIPIFVSHRSSDVWANQSEFHLDARGKPTLVAGCPPDRFCQDGQLWGNALYNWEAMARNSYTYWIKKLARLLQQFEVVRLDHFIGFHRYWAIPYGSATARTGSWHPGPGAGFFQAVVRSFPHAPFIAEDLGRVTPEVWHLRDTFGIPGMRIMQFGFATAEDAPYHRPGNFDENCVVYPGTHDNDTIKGWYQEAAAQDQQAATMDFALMTAQLGSEPDQAVQKLIEQTLVSPARLAVLQLQDILGLGSEARMNIPGSEEGNWTWRVDQNQLNAACAARLRHWCQQAGRVNGSIESSQPAIKQSHNLGHRQI